MSVATGIQGLLAGSPGNPLATAPQPDADVQRRYGVVVGGQRLLLDPHGSVRVVEPPPTFRLPNTRPWFCGISNLRGTLVPVFDLAQWLELPPPASRRMLLVLGDGDASVAVLADGSPRYLAIEPGSEPGAMPPLPGTLVRHALEAWSLADGTWVAIDWEALFFELKALALNPQ